MQASVTGGRFSELQFRNETGEKPEICLSKEREKAVFNGTGGKRTRAPGRRFSEPQFRNETGSNPKICL